MKIYPVKRSDSTFAPRFGCPLCRFADPSCGFVRKLEPAIYLKRKLRLCATCRPSHLRFEVENRAPPPYTTSFACVTFGVGHDSSVTSCGKKKKEKLSACRGEGSAVGLQLRVRFVPAALLAMLRTALASSVGPFGYACAPLYASEHVKQRNQGTEPTGR
jgi:hypothetical protein